MLWRLVHDTHMDTKDIPLYTNNILGFLVYLPTPVIEVFFGQHSGRVRASSVPAKVVNIISPDCEQPITT